MKILLLAESASSHTFKWVKSLHERGHELTILSLYPSVEPSLASYILENEISFYPGNPDFRGSFFSKLFLEKILETRRVIKETKPNIVHAHYASSYGLLGALSGFKKLIVSVWGSDVFEFPHQRFYTKAVLKFNLRRAQKICSTSHFMTKETASYTNKEIATIPFGVDLDDFKYIERDHKIPVVIGAIKSLEYVYGTDLLVEVFSELVSRTTTKVKLLLVGGGSLKPELESRIAELGMVDSVELRGYISHDKVYDCYKEIDVFTSFSKARESFGVSLIEAQATGLPVVVTPAGGFVEIIKSNEEGFVISSENKEMLVQSLLNLVENSTLRKSMGLKGHNKVKKYYAWEKCVDMQEEVYHSLKQN